MLSHDNLARHTLHHQELDVKRDFVLEYLESLERSAAPELDLQLSATTQRTGSAPVSSLKNKGSGGGNSKASPSPHHHRHRHHNQDKDKKGTQHDRNVPSSPVASNNPSTKARAIETAVLRQSSKKIVKSQQHNPTTNDRTKRKDVSKARQENSKHKKKRKKQPDEVELDVEKLDINAHYDVHCAPQQGRDQPEITDARMTVPQKMRPTVSSRKRVSKSLRLHDDPHGKQPPEQPLSAVGQGSRPLRASSLEDPHNTHKNNGITRLNKHSKSNTNSQTNSTQACSNTSNNTKHSSNFRSKHNSKSTYHLTDSATYANKEYQEGKEQGMKGSKKPRKILTQDSLVLNQFAPVNTTRGRITLPTAASRLGLFQKGKASQKIAVQDHRRGFSETRFLGRTFATPVSDSLDRPEKVVTSSYFAKPEDRVPSPRSEKRSEVSASENTVSTSALSEHSIERRMTQRYAQDEYNISDSSKFSGDSISRSDSLPQFTPNSSNSGLSLPTRPVSNNPLQSSGRNSPEHAVDAILQELIPKDCPENQLEGDEQGYEGQRYISREACIERLDNAGDSRMPLGQLFEAPSNGYLDSGQYFDMHGYPLEPQPNTRDSGVQQFTAVNVANLNSGNMYYEWHLEPAYRWPNGSAEYQGPGYPYYYTQGRAASFPGDSTYMYQEDQAQIGYGWQDQSIQQRDPMSSNQQARFQWRPHRFY